MLLNNKTIMMLNLAEYRLTLAYGVRPRRLSMRRYSARFRGIILNCLQTCPFKHVYNAMNYLTKHRQRCDKPKLCESLH